MPPKLAGQWIAKLRGAGGKELNPPSPPLVGLLPKEPDNLRSGKAARFVRPFSHGQTLAINGGSAGAGNEDHGGGVVHEDGSSNAPSRTRIGFRMHPIRY